MKKIIFILFLIPCLSQAQTKLYAVRFNYDLTTDSFFVHETICQGVYTRQGNYVMPCVDSMAAIYGYDFPNSLGRFVKCADGIYRNFLLSGLEIPGAYRFGIDNQANDTYVISVDPAPTSYSNGMMIYFRANTGNTGQASLNVNGLGAVTIVKRVNTTLANGDILANMICLVIYNGTNFVLLNPIVN